MKVSIKSLAGLMSRRSRKGQSIIIIAFAFMALIAFVGIATDVALLFVRYSTLRRSVDAAAIAAAGQVRETTDYIALNAIARQFIQVHGVSPTSVKVDTCETEIINWIKEYNIANPGSPKSLTNQTDVNDANAALITAGSDLCKPVPQKLVRVWAQVDSPTTFLSVFGFRTVRLQSSSVSQTAALDVAILLDTSLSGAYDTYLEETKTTSVNCYATLDSFFNGTDFGGSDTDWYNANLPTGYINPSDECNNAEGMRRFGPLVRPQHIGIPDANETTYGLGLAQFPLDPVVDISPAGKDAFNTKFYEDTNPVDGSPDGDEAAAKDAASTAVSNLINSQADTSKSFISTTALPAGKLGTNTIRYECWYDPFNQPQGASASNQVTDKANYSWGGCCNDPSVQTDFVGTTQDVTFAFGGDFADDPDWYIQDNQTWPRAMIMTTGTKIGGGASAQVLYGGVGDPNQFKNFKGDGNYSDLICQPFKDIRDAARRFIKRLDFIRGDRVILVTFAENAKAIKPLLHGGGTGQEVITDKNTAIRALNMQVGISIAPHNLQSDCHIYKSRVPDPDSNLDWLWQKVTDEKYLGKARPHNPSTNDDYWVISQCAGTNTGGGINAATAALTKPEFIRRDSVWVMVVLSDGFPNRTPALPTGAGDISEVGKQTRDWLIETDNPSSYSGLEIAQYCNRAEISDDPDLFGKKPHLCAGDPYKWGVEFINNDPAQPQMSFGFCPTWTRLKASGRQPRPFWQNISTYSGWSTSDPANPLCVDNDPDSRHFCMTADGEINPNTGTYQCDVHYDPEDYARDRVDFAALDDYTATSKGNFIAMYSIFFNREQDNNNDGTYNGFDLGPNILGVKMMRYIADAGDNGKIDNPIQRWYRSRRDLNVNPPPSGGFAYVSNPQGLAFTIDGTGTEQGVVGAAGTWLPDWSATNPQWKSTYDFDPAADPCAAYDVWYNSGGNDIRVPLDEVEYMTRVSTECGQYFYAKDANGVNKAFVEISSRLFTRLSR